MAACLLDQNNEPHPIIVGHSSLELHGMFERVARPAERRGSFNRFGHTTSISRLISLCRNSQASVFGEAD